MGFGGIGATGLLTVASTSDEAAASYWSEAWFVVLFALFALTAVAGVYIVGAGTVTWLPPKSWTPRQGDPETPDQNMNRLIGADWNKEGRTRPQTPDDSHEAGSTVNIDEEPEQDEPPTRQIVDVTADYLTGFHRDHMSVQAEKLTAPYLGKWMTHSGRLSNVGAFVGFCQVTFELEPKPDRVAVYMLFRDRQYFEDRLSVLKKGDQLTVLGQIDWIDAYQMQLDNCELVDA